MEFKEFREEIKIALEVRLQDGFMIGLNSITKNNGVVLHGITISNLNINVAPTIYLEEFYREYCKGRDFTSIVEDILSIYENNTYKEDLDLEFFTDFSRACGKIVFKLVSMEKNKELFEDVPYVPFLDLAIVFQCLVEHEALGNASILIRNSHLQMWNKSKEDVYELARSNTPGLLPPQIKGMGEILGELLGPADRERLSGEASTENCAEEIAEIPMFVMSNSAHVNGASVILYEGALAQFALRLQKDIIILPSSIHEVILIPFGGEYDRRYLEEMVREVNATQLDAMEILSDRVYIYKRDAARITFFEE